MQQSAAVPLFLTQTGARCLKWMATTTQHAPNQRTKSPRRDESLIMSTGIRWLLVSKRPGSAACLSVVEYERLAVSA